jgi:hypothetical protein
MTLPHRPEGNVSPLCHQGRNGRVLLETAAQPIIPRVEYLLNGSPGGVDN